jgi:hypothetical protein
MLMIKVLKHKGIKGSLREDEVLRMVLSLYNLATGRQEGR